MQKEKPEKTWVLMGLRSVSLGYWLGVTSDWTIEQPFGSKANFSGFFFPVKNCNKSALFGGHDETLSQLSSFLFDLFCFAAGGEAECVLCGDAKDFSEQIFCTSCGRHYHGRCLDPSVDLTPLIRMGWQCPDCKVCQGCRWADFSLLVQWWSLCLVTCYVPNFYNKFTVC